MLTELMRDYYAYARWANEKILDQAEKLTSQQYFESELDNVWPVHDTLVHMMSGQDVWLRRWRLEQNVGLADPEEYASLDAIRTRWDEIDLATIRYLDSLTVEVLVADCRIINYKGDPFINELCKQMLHQCNHQTYHRGEVAAILSRYGHSPGEIDYSQYFYGRANNR